MDNIKSSKRFSLFSFIKSGLNDINPWQNFKSLHTNVGEDIIAGITVAIIALPLALAFGQVSQLGPIAGILGAIAGGVIGGLFGGCIYSVSGPTAPTSSQISAFLGAFVIGSTNTPDLVAVFSIIFLSGLIMVGISMLKISHFIHFMPYSVVAGFMCGIGLMVIMGQINSLVGLEAKKNIHQVLEGLSYTVNNVNIEALYIGIPSLFIIFYWHKFKQSYKSLVNIPAPLAALLIGTGISYFFNLNVPHIGDQFSTTTQSQQFSLYIPDFSRIGEFMGPAFALAGLVIIDSLLSCIIADNLTGTRHVSDRETFGQGMANMMAGLMGGVTTATATMFTVSNIKFGGKTPLSSVIYGLSLLAILLGLKGFVAAIPIACIAAILIKVGVDIMDYRVLPILRKLPTMDLINFLIVLFITVYKNLMIAVVVGVIIAVVRYSRDIKSAFHAKRQHHMVEYSTSEYVPPTGDVEKNKSLPISILQPRKALFFGSIEPLSIAYGDALPHEMLIVDMSLTTKVDLSGTYALEDLIKGAEAQGIKVIVANANDRVKRVFRKVNFREHLGKGHYFDSTESSHEIIREYFEL